MDNRFASLFGLSEEESITTLDTPLEELRDEPGNPRYVAASQLSNFPSEQSVQALIRAIQNTNPELDNRIVRRKSVESLGRIKAVEAVPILRSCLSDEDCYTVENAVWSLGEIGADDPALLEEMAELLDKPGQTYRVIIHQLARLGHKPAVQRIQKFVDNEEKTIASAAITSIARLTGERAPLAQVVEFLQDSTVYTRRLAIQDLVDADHYEAIPAIAQSPVSVSFRLRGLRMLANSGVEAEKLTFKDDIEPWLDNTIRDTPKDIDLVHEYDQPPTLEFLISELYQTDFGRCYLAMQTLMADHRDGLADVLMANYTEKACDDYGGHYVVIKLLGWLKHQPAFDLIVNEGLKNPMPQFLKSQFASAFALADLGQSEAIPHLKEALQSPVWMVKYASLMALEQLGDSDGLAIAAEDSDWLIQAKAAQIKANASTVASA